MKKLFVIFITIALLCLSTTMVYGTGARADAMGGAFTAVANDGFAPFWNPAGMTQLKVIAINGSLDAWSSLDGNTGYFSLCGGITTSSLGANIDFGGLSVYDPGTGIEVSTGTSNLVLSAATDLFSKSISIGANFKLLGESYQIYQGADYWSFNGNGMAVDVGVLLKPADFLSVGVVGFNLNEPEIVLYDDWDSALNADDPDKYYSSIVMGLALKPSKSTTLAADFELYRDNQFLRLGLEQTALWDAIAVRLGMHENLEYPEEMVITFGGGLKIFGFYTDFAILDLESDNPEIEISGGFRW